ncbi:hypothetical protein GCG54_00007053 [Colletotrichum gloeosporioides]|uniref:Uncharacterized protein n=1 Tax=Colletotrichum gloeosporioides TaxID=474922 RepID=A0A8H4CMZ2_COLGL|nr:uncharacterized protein GCG54_00007053 [Colletotrichum gloeosporioides]KAF3806804.1 hypothetical protein GCG54_00007053 [Colletotrichum gloeosporioides]
MNLNREFQIISDLAKAKLAEMLQEESLEVLKAYVLQKGGSSSQTLQTDCSGSELLDPAAIDNSLFDNIEAIGDQGQDAFDFSFLEAYCQQAGYLSRNGPTDSRNEDPSSDSERDIDQGFGQRHLPAAIANTKNTCAGTHRLQASGHRSGINVKKLSPSRPDDEDESRSSRSSAQSFSNSSKEQDIDSTPCTHPTAGTESPSDESTPASSDNSEATLTKAILASCATEQIASDVTRNFMEIVRSKFGPRQRGPTSSQEQRQSSAHASRPSQDIRREAPQRGRQRLSNDRKRSRHSKGEDEDSDRAPNDKTPGSKRRKIAEADKPKIACPFMKHSPTEFSDVSKWRTCIGPGFDGMNRMKIEI